MPPRKIDVPPTIEGELAPAVVAAPVAADEALPARPWLDMSVAPKDGTLVEVLYPPHVRREPTCVRWRITRRRVDRGWRVVGFWADPVTREEVACEPDGWRMPDGYLTPGLVV